MSVNTAPEALPLHATERPVEQIAREVAVDPRVAALVPGFDAPFYQAGLAGYSDGAMRLVARSQGCPFCVTEALLDRTLLAGGKGKRREDPDLLERCGTGALEGNTAAGARDHPIAGQLMGSEPGELAEAAAMLAEMGYDAIDINFACPVKKIRSKHRGGHMLTAPELALEILREVRAAVPAHLPTTLKLRRAFDETPEAAACFDRILDGALELGFAWATVHCRTVRQKYDGPGSWERLAQLVARRPGAPIFGSGDIWRAGDIFRMIELTGVIGVSVARGCIGDPWIFRRARALMAGEPSGPPTIAEQRDVLASHFELSVALHGERSASRMMRKFGIKFSRHHPAAAAVKASFIRCRSLDDWRAVLDSFYSDHASADIAG